MPKYLFTILTAAYCSLLFTANAQQTILSNPLVVHNNYPMAFDKINATVIRDAVKYVIKLSNQRIKKIAAIPSKEHTIYNTLMAVDELKYDINDLLNKLDLISDAYPDDSTRNAANDELEKLTTYSNDVYLNEELYNSIKQFALSAKQLRPDQQKYLNDLIIAFEKNGMKLNAANKEKLKVLNEKLATFGTQFDKNIAQSKDSVLFTADDLQGVPETTSAPWKRADGNYLVKVTGPNYTDILKYAQKAETRHTMYLHYNNRAYPANIKVLDSLFYYRQQFANVLGFKSYAAYALVDKMAKNTATVWKFERDIMNKLTPHVTAELDELKKIKKQTDSLAADTIYAWDLSYYTKILLDTKYQLNTDEVKQYFEMNNTLQGMFNVYQKLFDIQIKPLDNVPLWEAKVKAYEMYEDGKKVGTFYLDLYPRSNKYQHFACFPISQYRLANGKEVLPVAALLCNFPEGNAEQPSLLNHSDVVSMFHEFGHLVHNLLGRSEIASQASFFVKSDFVEAPSQFLENFCWEYEPLKIMARNYKTGASLPDSLFKKMKATQYVNVANFYIRQVSLGLLDFTYEDKYDSIKGEDINKVWKDIFPIWQIPYPEGTHFICSFTHLRGYAANYYGYLWSKVFAQDLFSVFKKNGVMDRATGIRYRKDILEKAASMDEMDMLRNFLGREPNSDAFLESLGIK